MVELLAAFGLGVGEKLELVAFVGGGGKTGLMFALANAWPGHVVTTTTTRIFAAQMKLSPAVLEIGDWQLTSSDSAPQRQSLLATLQSHLAAFGQCLVVGGVGEGTNVDKALGVPVEAPGWLLAQPGVTAVLVEADGSRMKPIKAPAAHEPVIPPETTLLVAVVGIDALAGPLEEVAHRPERVRALLGSQSSIANRQSPIVNHHLTAAGVARLLNHPQGGLKDTPTGARATAFINKVETADQLTAAREIARLALTEPGLERVVIGSLRAAEVVLEVWPRVTAVILAAGSGQRMGQTKQLLPWGDTTILGQVIRHAQAATVQDVWVVAGHEAAAVSEVAAAAGVTVVHNPAYETGEMVSSLQTAVRHLPDDVGAVLVMLADQPLVTPDSLDSLLNAYRQSQRGLIAPTYKGQRGNPVLIDRRYFAELLALPAGSAPRVLLQRHPADLLLVEVGETAVLQDLDHPEDYQRWRPTPPYP
jgi:molybdenum cofactor cytidylyltransferase